MFVNKHGVMYLIIEKNLQMSLFVKNHVAMFKRGEKRSKKFSTILCATMVTKDWPNLAGLDHGQPYSSRAI